MTARAAQHVCRGSRGDFRPMKLEHPGIPAFRGEHNGEVLRELGYNSEQIAELTSRNVMTKDPAVQ